MTDDWMLDKICSCIVQRLVTFKTNLPVDCEKINLNFSFDLHTSNTPVGLCNQLKVFFVPSELISSIWIIGHISSIIGYFLPALYTGIKLYCLMTEARVWTTCLTQQRLAQSRTGHLSIASPIEVLTIGTASITLSNWHYINVHIHSFKYRSIWLIAVVIVASS